ncbi:hypothetical protein B0H14DRAFT_3077201, partial [Mycena olivaceomarginata]
MFMPANPIGINGITRSPVVTVSGNMVLLGFMTPRNLEIPPLPLPSTRDLPDDLPPQDTPKSLVSTIRDTLSVARAKKSVTVATYAKLFTALDTLDLLLQSEDRVEASLKAFKADILAAPSSYASTAASSALSAPPPSDLRPPLPPSRGGQVERDRVLLDRGSDLLSRPLHEIKGRSKPRLRARAQRPCSGARPRTGPQGWRRTAASLSPRCQIVPSSPTAAQEIHAHNRGTIADPSVISEVRPPSATRRYEEPPLLCFNCQGYGHTQHQCKQKTPTCARCAGPHRSSSCPATSSTKCGPGKRCEHYSRAAR